MTIRLGFSGTGYIARIHATAAQALGVEVASVSNHRSGSREEFAERFGVKRQHVSVEEMLNAGGMDALVICTPNAFHAPEALSALEAGVPVLVEKPMAMNAIEAMAMHATAERTGVPLMIAHCWRFDEEARWLRGRIDEGALGRPIRTKSYGVHVDWGPRGWFTKPTLSGGGAMMDMGIHAIDTARFLLGDPRPMSVYARIGTHYREVDVDDTGLVIITWRDGMTSYIESGWFQPQADSPEAACQVYGSEGFGRLYPTVLRRTDSTVQDPKFAFPREPHCSPSMYQAQMAAFVDCVRTGRVGEAGPLVGLDNMRVLDAAYASARTDTVIHL